jgi:hypothetical protein
MADRTESKDAASRTRRKLRAVQSGARRSPGEGIPGTSDSSTPSLFLRRLRTELRTRADRELRAAAYALEREIGDAISIVALSLAGYPSDQITSVLSLTPEEDARARARLRDALRAVDSPLGALQAVAMFGQGGEPRRA